MDINPLFKYPPPIARTLGFDLVDAGEHAATIEIVTDLAKHANPMGTVHGGVLCNASIVASKGLPANSVYSATKAAVRSFARTWTTDLKDRRIRVNVVSPGSTDTGGLRELLGSSEVGQQRLKAIHESVPLGRLAKPQEIA